MRLGVAFIINPDTAQPSDAESQHVAIWLTCRRCGQTLLFDAEVVLPDENETAPTSD